MTTEAQKRASKKYQRDNVKQKSLKFYPKDYDIFEYLSGLESRNAYIMSLIRADMEKGSR